MSKWALAIVWVVGAASACLPHSGRFADAAPPAADRTLEAAEEQSFRRAVDMVAGSVVRIQTVGGLDRVGGMLTGTASTTGVVVSEDGYVVSSAFNFISRPTSILIRLADGRPFAARLVATDHLRMITLLKCDATGLVPLRPRPGHKARVGQWVMAVGRTYDSPSPSVSVGIVSALNRVWGKAIQTDAKVSPVNYGGPLVDLAGRVLGIVVPLSPSGKEEAAGVEWYDSGIGFAIPFDEVMASVERLKGGKDLVPGLLGITIKDGAIDQPPAIDHVRFDSPAEKAGLKPGDVFAEVDGRPLRRHDELKQALGKKYAGEKIVVVVRRADQRVRSEVELAGSLPPYEPGFLGILPARGVQENSGGVVVRYVFPQSAASAAGIVAGDRILKWNNKSVDNADQLSTAVRRLRPGSKVRLVLKRRGREESVDATLASDVEKIPADLPAARPSAPTASAPTTSAKGGQVDEPKKAEPGKPAQPAQKPKTGHFRDKLSGDSGQSYWAYVPDSYSPQDTWGLLVWIPPHRDTMEAPMVSRWKAACEERRLIIVSPIPSDPVGFSPNDLVGTRQVIDLFLNAYRIDRNRLVVHGFATGGPFAAFLSFEDHERIRGLALASALLGSRPPDAHPNFPQRFFFFSREGDRTSDQLKRIAELLRKMKFAVTVETSGGESGYLSADDVSQLARWVDSLDRI